MKISEGIAHFLENLRSQRRMSAHTLRAYECDLRDWTSDLTARGWSELADLGSNWHPSELRPYLSKLFDSHEKSSIARRLSAIRGFLRHARKENWIKQDLGQIIPTPKQGKTLPRFLGVDQALELIRSHY
jgi:site-specific recombinase XerD